MMRLLGRLVCVIAGVLVILAGVDGLRINTEPKTLTIEEIEQRGVGDARYINVVGGQANGSYVVEETRRENHVLSVMYPVFSSRRLSSAAPGSKAPVSLVLNSHVKMECSVAKQCEKTGPIHVTGVVQGGPVSWLRSVNKDSLKAIKYPMAANFVFVDEGPPDDGVINGIYIGVGAILFSLGLLKKESFRRYVTGR